MGQHFLKDENICRKIVAALQEQSFTQLLEVGPGAGALTKYLLKLPGIDFKAVELDEEKVLYLLKMYPALEGKIIHESILDITPPLKENLLWRGIFLTIFPRKYFLKYWNGRRRWNV